VVAQGESPPSRQEMQQARQRAPLDQQRQQPRG
jgi:hypothetical protein